MHLSKKTRRPFYMAWLQQISYGTTHNDRASWKKPEVVFFMTATHVFVASDTLGCAAANERRLI